MDYDEGPLTPAPIGDGRRRGLEISEDEAEYDDDEVKNYPVIFATNIKLFGNKAGYTA